MDNFKDLQRKMSKRVAFSTLAAILNKPIYFKSLWGKINEQYFKNDTLREIVKLLNDFYRQHNHFPTYDLLITWIDSSGLDIDVSIKKRLRKLDKLGKEMFAAVDDPDVIIHTINELYKAYYTSALSSYGAALMLEGMQERKPLQSIIDSLQEHLQQEVGIEDTGLIITQDIEATLDMLTAPDLIDTVPTGFPHLDMCIGGGLGRGELGVIMGAAKVGKSFALVNIGGRAVMKIDRYNVFHYSLEMSDKRTAIRYYNFFSRMKLKGLSSKERREIIDKISRKLNGELVIKSAPTRAMGYSDICSHIDGMIAQGIHPDMVIVDYGDIMRPERRTGQRREEEAACFEDLRRLADKYNVAVWTATQANRKALSKAIVRMEDVAESFEKIQIADLVVAISQNEKEQQSGHWRFSLAAIRNSASNVVIDCEVDFDRALIKTLGTQRQQKMAKKKSTDKIPDELEDVKDKQSGAAAKVKEILEGKSKKKKDDEDGS